MNCPRCQGLMCKEWAKQRRAAPVQLWACLLCGERLDDTIRFNRAFHKPESVAHRNERIMRRYFAELLKVDRAPSVIEGRTI